MSPHLRIKEKRPIFRPMVIFIGPQGSGKSTQVDLLFNWLQSHNLRVKKTHILHKHLFAYLFEKILIMLGRYSYWVYPSGEKTKVLDYEFERRILRLWFFMQVFSVIVTVFFRVYLRLWSGFIVIAERYIPDAVIHLLMISDFHNPSDSFVTNLTRHLLRYIPKNSLIIFLNCKYPVLKQRYNSRGSQTEPEFYISRYVELYPVIARCISSNSHVLIMDTARIDEQETFEEIKKNLTVTEIKA